MITAEELSKIMPDLPSARRDAYLPFLQAAMTEFDITTFRREAAFLAQLAHESGQFRFMEEIADGHLYEGRKDLGNVHPGDGKRYKGRGPIQLTGRANYRRFGKLLGLDLEGEPLQAATPQVGFRIAGLYWKDRHCNELADAMKFVAITRKINGGVRGLADRQQFYHKALNTLSKGDPIPAEVDTPDDTEVQVVVNGQIITLDDDPTAGFIEENTNYVPLRAVAEVLGVTIVDVDGDTAKLQRGALEFAVPIEIRANRGYVPARELSNHLSGSISFDQGKRSLSLQIA